jgi:hypothetical protein
MPGLIPSLRKTETHRPRQLVNILLLCGSVMFGLAAVEAAIRIVDGLPLFALPLPQPVGSDTAMARFDEVPRAAGIERTWFFRTPPPVPNRSETPAQWQHWFDDIERSRVVNGSEFRGGDMFKVWNSVYVGNPCARRYFRGALGHLFVYDPENGLPSPHYRFLTNMTAPDGLVTNDYGWRGPPVPFERGSRTVRIVFAGSSTTVSAHHYPHAFPEFVGYWLNLWSQARGLGIRFETMNAAREGIDSTDIAAIVHEEVLPLRPDLVMYYEGANQFDLDSLVPEYAHGRPAAPRSVATAVQPQGRLAAWLLDVARYSAIARRVQAAIGAAGEPTAGAEWPKPDYTLVWPIGVDERDPDINRPDLPVHLGAILRDFDRMRSELAGTGAELALSSYKWMVHDGMSLDPVRHRYTLEHLNAYNYPYRYRDLERLALFQNRVFAKYARLNDLDFVDVVKFMPDDPDLFVDAIHKTYAGERVMGWVVFNQLVPLIEQRLASGAWPRSVPAMAGPHPAFRTPPRLITFTCGP